MNNEYAKAYTEVLTILKEIPKDEYEKIPNEEIQYYIDNCDKDYKFKIDKNIPLNMQNISKKTNAVLVNIFKDFFASEIQKDKLNTILRNNFWEEEENKEGNYSYNDLFSKKPNLINVDNENNEDELNNNEKLLMQEYKKSIFRDIINKIRYFFKNIKNDKK